MSRASDLGNGGEGRGEQRDRRAVIRPVVVVVVVAAVGAMVLGERNPTSKLEARGGGEGGGGVGLAHYKTLQ